MYTGAGFIPAIIGGKPVAANLMASNHSIIPVRLLTAKTIIAAGNGMAEGTVCRCS